jgi:23S rRNA (cytidine1920-2'-O)/16S rRNA (cytidine1409-2'-O)-methyltransferase
LAKPKKKSRLDQALVDQGLAVSPREAASLILSGRVRLEGQRVNQAGAAVRDVQLLQLQAPEHPFAGRGGLKLEKALVHFEIPVEGAFCLDVGSSTGGFTDCLLQRGAAKVWAVDVGRGQLDWKLRQDPRVVSMEKTHAKTLRPQMFPRAFDFFCMDVSFISARSLLPFLAPLLKPGGEWVVLVKPQFEAPRKWVEKGGLVTKPEVQREACGLVFEAARSLGLNPCPAVDSPIQGAQGNREFLLAGRKEK